MTTLALSGQGIFDCLIWLVIAGLIFWVANWALAAIGLPEPFAKICKVVLVLVALLIVVNALLTLGGSAPITWRGGP